MIYSKQVVLKNGQSCLIRNATEQDAQDVLDNYFLTHGQTDYLSTYPDEPFITLEKEKVYLKMQEENARAVFLVAEIEHTIIGTAMIDCVKEAKKTRHRSTFGLSIDKTWWGIGIGRALTEACIECAKNSGYRQIELAVVSENERAIALYKSVGFIEYGRNPKAFQLRNGAWQEVILMMLEIEQG